jgi:hypothetical protein
MRKANKLTDPGPTASVTELLSLIGERRKESDNE